MVGRKGNLSEVPKGIRFQMLSNDIINLNIALKQPM